MFELNHNTPQSLIIIVLCILAAALKMIHEFKFSRQDSIGAAWYH